VLAPLGKGCDGGGGFTLDGAVDGHYHCLDDPDDTLVLDDIAPFTGNGRQLWSPSRSGSPSGPAGRSPSATSRCLPCSARRVPPSRVHRWCTRNKGAESRIADPGRNLVAELHGGIGDVEEGLAAAARRLKAPGAMLSHRRPGGAGCAAHRAPMYCEFTSADGLAVACSSLNSAACRSRVAWRSGSAPRCMRSCDWTAMAAGAPPRSARTTSRS
jgi:hypothetical protein